MSYQAGSAGPEQRAELFAERREREVRPRVRGVVATLATLLVMGFFSGGLWLAYHEGLRHATGSAAGVGSGEVPLIRADERPTKVKPEKPGGMEIPDRDKLIYTQKRAAVEHLLPPPEKPMARPGGPSSAVQPEPPPLSAAPPNAPGAVTSAPAAATPAEPQQIAAKPPTKAAPESPGAAKSASLQSSPAKPGATRIQLGSVHSEDAARQEWDRIKRTNSDLLGSLSATPVRADLGDKGVFYRILTGPITDAERLCGELRRRNVGCIIAR